MEALLIDKNRLNAMVGGNLPAPAPDRLFREGSVFFAGGELPIFETLQTMFDSFCAASTKLFYLTLGVGDTLPQGMELARQIKKNFHRSLIARLDQIPSAATLERLYAAGVDSLDFHLAEFDVTAHAGRLQAALQVFPRWGVAVSLDFSGAAPAVIMASSDALLQMGVLPLPKFAHGQSPLTGAEIEGVFQHLLAGWEKRNVALSQWLPLLAVSTPLASARPAGLIRAMFDRARYHQQLAGAELRRHLRVQQAEDSLDSAVL